MELRQLIYFVKVANKQHVTKAAEELHVAQSAVSRQIHQLEEELGVKLFIPKGRNLQLTPVGKLFLRRMESIISQFDKAVEEVHEFMDPELGEIRLGFPHSLGVDFVPLLVSKFKKLHPNVKFRFKQGKYNTLIKSLKKGDIDLALISPFPEDDEYVTGEVLLTEELFAILPPDHVLSNEKEIRLDQLKDESFVLFNEEYSLRTIVWDACEMAGFTPNIGFEGEETDTIRGLVAAGMGVSLLPDMALKSCLTSLQPAKIKVIDPVVDRTIGIIHRKDEKLPLVADFFKRFITEKFKGSI
ncbi:LysR family transcriptional regulator [Chengkuizengella sediminis]|uniref:LysR family transcriptional regulator n=1 Tax=Chengkuizengella sediminis TaxID=1885917 RepID=UPI00138A5045|nr:LysR family transcriptional regulator [Chengkuizengella sediminis]NDI36417.1 LysR family transcriptional regulator [Chengkuizengella sediminis]